jgi:hypothetical protein
LGSVCLQGAEGGQNQVCQDLCGNFQENSIFLDVFLDDEGVQNQNDYSLTI